MKLAGERARGPFERADSHMLVIAEEYQQATRRQLTLLGGIKRDGRWIGTDDESGGARHPARLNAIWANAA